MNRTTLIEMTVTLQPRDRKGRKELHATTHLLARFALLLLADFRAPAAVVVKPWGN